MDLNQRLWDLWEIEEADREAAIKVLKMLYGNILKDPNNPKFRDLNFSKIRRKFEKAKPAFYLLYTAGFGQSIDGSRLQFQLQNMKMLEAANAGLDAKIANPDDPKLLPKSQKPKESASSPKIIKDKSFKNKYASNSAQTHEIERQNSQLDEQSNDKTNDSNNNNNDNTNKTDNDNDTDMTGNQDANNDDNEQKDDKPVDNRTEEEKEKDRQEVKNALDGLDDADMELLSQIQASKDTTVSLSMAELAGLSKEEKIELFKKKQKQFRKEKEQVARRNQIEKEKKRRDNVKMAQIAKEERKQRQMAMLSEKKKREKEQEKLRKQRIRQKIKEDKERKKREKEYAQQKKEREAAAAAAAAANGGNQ